MAGQNSIFPFLNLETESYEKYVIIFRGKTKLNEEITKYQFEAFFYPLLKPKNNRRYDPQLIISRMINLELSKWCQNGFAFNNKNQFAGVLRSGDGYLLDKSFKIPKLKKYIDPISKFESNNRFPARYISTPKFLSELYWSQFLKHMGIEDDGITESLRYIPCLKFYSKGTAYILPIFEIISYFFFENIKITNAILDGSFRDDIGAVSKIMIEENTGKRIAFVSVADGYSETEKVVLAWLACSNEAFDEAKYILNTVRYHYKETPHHFIRSKIPTNHEIELNVKGYYIDKLTKKTFICNQIAGCSNFLPFDEIVYTPLIDRRSITDKEEKDILPVKSYTNYQYEFAQPSPDNEKDNPTAPPKISEDDPSKPNQIPATPVFNLPANSFFSQNLIKITPAEKISQDYQYKGRTITYYITGDNFTVSDKKSETGTAISIHSIIEIKRIEVSENYQIDFIDKITKELAKEFQIRKLDIALQKTFWIFEIVGIKSNFHFYLLERIGIAGFNRRLLLLHKLKFENVDMQTLEYILNGIKNTKFTLDKVEAVSKKYSIEVRGFNRFEKGLVVKPEDVAETIKVQLRARINSRNTL